MYSLEPTPVEMAKMLAERFRLSRKQMKFSQEEMAERSGVSLGSLKRFERTGKISMESFLKLMHLLRRLPEIDQILRPKENLDEVKKLFTI